MTGDRLVRRFFRFTCAGFLVFAVAIAGVALVLTVQQRQVERATIDRQIDACTNQADFRRTFADVLDKVAHPTSTTASVDFAQVPGFDQLDAATQAYLRALTVRLSQPGDNVAVAEILTDYVSRFPIPDCDALRAKLQGHP